MRLKFLFLIIGILIAGRLGFNQEKEIGFIQEIQLFKDLKAEQEIPIELELKFNVKEFQREKYSKKYLPAILSYRLDDSVRNDNLQVKIKARGINRLKRCSFPPIFINIKDTDLGITQLEHTSKIKLVTHCRGKNFESLVFKEYLAYRMYNIISPFSFRVRLAKIKYIDTGRENKVTETWGILKEPEQLLAERVNAIPTKVDYVNLKLTDCEITSYMSIFQFMIGNPDYSIQGRHNVKLLVDKDPFRSEPIPVPYDFDYSGIVNAYYAVPDEKMDIDNVTQRFFLGPCRSVEEYQEIMEHFCSKKEEIFELVDCFEYLSRAERDNMILYLKEFFKNCTNEQYIKDRILITCR